MSSKYPRWIKFVYEDMGKERKYTGCMNNAEMILQAIHRLHIRLHTVKQVIIDKDTLLSQEEIETLFEQYEKNKEALEDKDRELETAMKKRGK